MTFRTLIDSVQVSPFIAVLIAGSLSFAHLAAAGEPSPWRVTVVEGPVQARVGQGGWSDVRQEQSLPPGSHVITGTGARLTLLSHGGDEIAAGSDTDFTVSDGSADEPYSIMQSLGRMLFRMESRKTRDFSVGTPYLAAAIKGTTFTVDVEANGASVSVDEGTVEVTVATTGEVLMVDAGGSVTASGNGRGELAPNGKGPVDVPGSSGVGAWQNSVTGADRGRGGASGNGAANSAGNGGQNGDGAGSGTGRDGGRGP